MGRLFSRARFSDRRRSSSSAPPDEVGRELVRRWRRGDAAAFNDIFRTYKSLVYGVLRHLLHDDPEIEDVVQTAFVEVYRSLSSFEGRSKLSSWIARVALHTGYHHLRRRKSRKADYESERFVPEIADDTARADPARQLDQREAIAHVYEILQTIAPKKRTVFILNDLQGLPQEEVAEIVQSSIATVRTRLFYARREFWKRAEKDPVLAEFATEGRAVPQGELTRARKRPIDRGGGD